MRIRIRIPDDVGSRLAALLPTLRAHVVATVLGAHTKGVDLAELLGTRRELVRLGTLLNQSLRTSRGLMADPAAVERAAEIVSALVKK